MRVIVAIFLLMIALDRVSASDSFTLTVYRQYAGTDCTSGYLAVNGDIICYTLERPWNGNAPLISSIPAGTYSAHVRYDHADAWRIELDDVPDRPNVQIHVGNFVANSVGCILVGSGLNASDPCTVTGSNAAYTKLKNLFYGSDDPNSTPDKDISVEIKDAGT
jgi:Family of unknown function (DUF5675)